MYQEMLNLVRDYSDARKEMNSQYEDPLSSNYEAGFGKFAVEENDQDMEDRDDDSDTDIFEGMDADEIVAQEIARDKFELSNFTFMGGADKNELVQNELASKMNSIEHVREFLEAEIGEETLIKVYPLLLDIGDDVFYEENADLLVSRLKHLMPVEQIKKYTNFFATLIFFEK